jgi:hypothetical protein
MNTILKPLQRCSGELVGSDGPRDHSQGAVVNLLVAMVLGTHSQVFLMLSTFRKRSTTSSFTLPQKKKS